MSSEFITRRNFVKIGVAAGTLLASGGLLAACASNEPAAETPTSNDAQTQQPAQQAEPAPAQPEAAPAPTGTGKVLVAYFSAQGHTRAVAETLADELGAGLFEIVPEQPYSDADLDWTDNASRVTREHDDEAPAVSAISQPSFVFHSQKSNEIKVLGVDT